MKRLYTHNPDSHLARRLWLMWLLIVGWSSCSQVEVADSVGGENGEIPLEIRATTGAEVDTRAVTAVEMTEGTLGIFRLPETDYTALENIRYNRVAGENWKPASTVIYVGATYARLCAYAPYNSVEFKNSSLKTEAGLTMQTYAAEKDMRFAVSGGDEVWKKTPTANFELKRAYARLVLSVVRDATYPNTCKITKAKIKASAGNIITANTVDISTGTEGSGTQTPQYIHTVTTGLKDGFAIGVTDDTSFDWLLPQQTFSGGGVLTLTVDGMDYSVTIPADKLSTFVRGTKYTVSLVVKGGKLTLLSDKILIDRDWTEVQTGTGGGGGDYDTSFN